MRSLEVHSRAPTLDWVRETSGRNWTLKPRSKENDKYIGRKKEGKVPSREMAWAKTGGKRQVKEVAPFKEPREVHRCPVLSSSLSLEPPPPTCSLSLWAGSQSPFPREGSVQ